VREVRRRLAIRHRRPDRRLNRSKSTTCELTTSRSNTSTMPLPGPLLALLLALLPALATSSPSPAFVSDDFLHLIPRNTLFFRQTQSSDLQTFTGNLGGFSASPITNSGDAKRPFTVDGDTFTDFSSAAQRSCDNQFQECSQAANAGGNEGGLTVGECDGQKSECYLFLFSAEG